jgi:hypothetical protein
LFVKKDSVLVGGASGAPEPLGPLMPATLLKDHGVPFGPSGVLKPASMRHV